MITTVQTIDVIVLAAGRSTADRSNARGHLFEQFTANLLETYGYESPTTRSLNVSANGIELDVVTKHAATGQPAIAECKVYSTNVPADRLSAFYGDLTISRMKDPATFGFFMALPRLTAEGEEQARTIADSDRNFKLLTATEIVAMLRSRGLLNDRAAPAGHVSDRVVVITEHGMFEAVKQLDPNSRLAEFVLAWGLQDQVPDPVVQLLEDSDYAGGLRVQAFGRPTPVRNLAASVEPTVVEVTGGSSDFEYQLPASPRFFVGRGAILDDLTLLAAPSEARGRIVVFNAQSGWGKSSLALRFKAQVEAKDGVALVLDSRTAAGPEFVHAAIRKLALRAQASGLITLPVDASYAGLASSLDTLVRADWRRPPASLVVFFDQFENVFQDERVTREFRDLALAIAELQIALTVGFAWKTDLIGWTESHPYRLRDEIRDRGSVFTVVPFGPGDLTTLLRRLEKALGTKINPDLSRRLREYSQGLPWLFKKLASHILRELSDGKSQEALLAEGLNVQRLFEADLAELSPAEQEGLKALARAAPVPISEISELVPHPIIQSLVNRRLVVAVGERMDTYWDIFRDFLNTGRVPVRETYILRVNPAYVAKLLDATLAAGGSLTVSEAARQIGTSEGVVFNASRDLRQMGVLVPAPGLVRVSDEILAADDKEEAVRDVISRALRRHRAYELLGDELERNDGELFLARFAEVLPEAFPAVQAQAATWDTYARAFVNWFSYARLVTKVGDRVRTGVPQSTVKLLGGARVTTRARRSFPQSPPQPAMRVARVLAGQAPLMVDAPSSTIQKAVGDLAFLGIVEIDEHRNVALQLPIVDSVGLVDQGLLQSLLARLVPGGADALDLIRSQGNSTAPSVGAILREAQGAGWSPSTTAVAGKHFLAWGRLALGVTGRQGPRRRRQGQLPAGQSEMFDPE